MRSARPFIRCICCSGIALLCCVGSVHCAHGESPQTEPANARSAEDKCGAMALAACAQALGQPRHWQEFAKLIPEARNTLPSLLDLKHAAGRAGFYPAAYRWGGGVPDCPLGLTAGIAAITLPNGRPHYVALLASQGNQLLVSDPPYRTVWISDSDFRTKTKWDGVALYLTTGRAAAWEVHLRALGLVRLILCGTVIVGVICWFAFVLKRRGHVRQHLAPGRQPPTSKVVNSRSGFTSIEVLLVLATIGLLFSLCLPAIVRSREQARAMKCKANLMQIGQALAAHEAVQGRYPEPTLPARSSGSASGLFVSMHYRLLPFLDHQALYESVSADDDGTGIASEPVSSKFNDAALHTSIAVFVCPTDAVRPGGNSYRSCAGTSPGFHLTPDLPIPEAARAGFAMGKVRYASHFRDGLSQTVVFSERLVGDADPANYHPTRDTALISGSFLTAGDAERGCRLTLNQVTRHASFGGSTWLYGGYGHTHYNHILQPNSETPDCAAEVALLPGAYGAHTARSYHDRGVNVLYGSGAVKVINEQVDLTVWRAMGTIDSAEMIPSQDP